MTLTVDQSNYLLIQSRLRDLREVTIPDRKYRRNTLKANYERAEENLAADEITAKQLEAWLEANKHLNPYPEPRKKRVWRGIF